MIRLALLALLGLAPLPSVAQFIVPRNVPCTSAVVGDTTPGTLDLKATLQSIGVRASYSGDGTADATATFQYRTTGAATWHDAYPPIIDRRATIVSANDNVANQNQARGSIVGLTENASYDVKVTWTDSGASSCVSGTVTTATSTPPTGGTSYFVNSASGNDGNNGLTSGTAWATLTFALANTAAGDVINCNGTFAVLTISTSGTGTAYRKLQNETSQTCTLSSGSANTLILSGDYWWVKGLTLGASTTGAVLKISGARQHVYVTDVTIPDYTTSEGTGAGGAGDRGGIVTTTGVSDVFLLRNSITRTTATCGQQGANGVTFAGSGHVRVVVDSNTITGGAWDAIGNNSNSSLSNLESVDISNNTLTEYYDDATELDGAGINLRFWGNTTHTNSSCSPGGNTALSEAGTMVGPSYIFRNYFNTKLGVGIKGGHTAVGYAFIFHNTFVIERASGGYQALTQNGGSPYSQNHVYRNNIYQTNTQNLWEREGPRAGNSYDYDVAWCNGCGTAISLWDNTTNYATWAAFLAAVPTQEVHSAYGNPNLDGSYHITNTSNAYDIGVSLANFNTSDSFWPYAHSAPDIGAYEVP